MNNNFLQNIFESKKFKPFIWLAILGFVIYFPTLFFGFTYLDDNNLILDHQYFLTDLGNIFKSFLTDVFHLFNTSAFYYRPILTLSLMFDYQIGGISPFMYHFSNILLHVVSSYLIFVLLTKLNYKKIISFVFATLFLVHPVLTQAVSWIPGRNDSLLAVVVLSCFIFFINYLEKNDWKNLLLALLFFGLSIFTKESGIFLLPILLFFLIFIYRKGKKLSIKNFYFFFGSIFVIGLWVALRHFALSGGAPTLLSDIFKSVFINLPAVLLFVGKIFLPFNLSVLPVIPDSTFIYGIISIIVLIFLVVITKNKRWNIILFGIGWFFAFLLPSFIRPNPNLLADFIEHRVYVPMIGIFLILLETDFIKKIDLNKKKHLIIISSIIIIFSVMTVVHSFNFANKTAFWENAAKNSPSYPLAHRNLGAMKYLDGDMETAEIEFKKALSLNSQEQMAHNNLGLIYASRGMFKEAEEEYNKELEINPYYDNAYFNLGLLYFGNGQMNEAVDNWEKTIYINPDHFGAMRNLAIYYYTQKDYEKSIFYSIEVIKRGGDLPVELLKLVQPFIYR